MAGAAVVPPMSLWPRTLRRNGKAAEGKRNKKFCRKENPYASTSLETFAVVVTELQAKKKKQLRLAGTTGVVEKTISELSSKAPESDKNEEGKVMDMEDVDKGGGAGGGNRQEDCAQEEAAAAAATGCAHREAEGGIFELPWKMRAASKKRRGGLTCVRSKTASKAPSAMLVAVGTFLASKRAEFGKGIAAAMTFSIVIRKWRNGKLYARFIFSAMASYFLGHLQHSYLFFQRSPKHLTFGSPPGLRIKLQDEQPKKLGSAATMEQQEQEQKSSSFEFPILLPGSSSSPPPSPIPLGPAATEMKSPRTHPVSSPKTSSKGSSNASPSRNDLGRKLLSWRLKSRLMKSFRLSKGAAESLPDLSPTIKTENSDSDAASSQRDAAVDSSPKKFGNRFSFSRKPKASSEFPKVAEKRSGRAAIMSNAQTTNEVQSFTTMTCASSGLRNIKTSFLPTTATIGDRKEMLKMCSSSSVSSSSSLERGGGGGEMWLLCGLFIALLFLLMGQVPAILVTSVFFLVLSQLQKWRSSRVGQAGRDQKDVTRRTLEEASRKLHIPSIPGSPVRSPPPPSRADITSTEYRKRIIIEGLLERNRKGNS